MKNFDIKKLENFVTPFYVNKDIMHDVSHIKRIIKLAKKLSKNYKTNLLIICGGAYLHGFIKEPKLLKQTTEYLISIGLTHKYVNKITQAARESQKNSIPKTIEGKILHDAHLIEGGKTFWITKILITGTARGQSFEETIKYIKHHLLDTRFIGKFRCYLPEAQRLYRQKENFAVEFATDLIKNI